MNKLWLITFSLLFAVSCAFCQEISLEKEEQRKMEFAGVFKSSLSLELGGKSGFAGLSYDFLVSRHVRFGIGGGFAGAGADAKLYPFGVKRERLLLNIGWRSTAAFWPGNSGLWMHSIPVGLTYFAPNRLNLELDVGPLFKQPFQADQSLTGLAEELNYVWFSVKIGYRFSFYAMKRARELNAN